MLYNYVFPFKFQSILLSQIYALHSQISNGQTNVEGKDTIP